MDIVQYIIIDWFFIFYFNLIYLCNFLLLPCMHVTLSIFNNFNWLESYHDFDMWKEKDWINYFLIFILLSLPSQASYINKMHLIFMQNIFLGVTFYDVTCNCDLTGSPFLENMASLKKCLGLNRKSKCERKVNFLH